MIVGYLINVYPRPNQSFIRREIVALEKQGVHVNRYALRPSYDEVDEADIAEKPRTRFILEGGKLNLLLAALSTLLTRPTQAIAALRTAIRIGWNSDRGTLRHLVYWAEACVLRKWLAQDGVDHLHAHYGTNTAAIAMLTRLLGGPGYSFTLHGPEEFDRPQQLALRDKVNHAAFVVAISEFGRSQLYRWCPHSQWEKIHIVHCGVDSIFLGVPSVPVPAKPTFVSVGRLAEQKGQLLLIEASAALARRGIEFELILVGGGEMEAELRQLIQRMDLESRVKMVGWKSNTEIRDLMLDSRALVMPSFAEGLPVVIMESLAVERPVLSTYLAGIPELVEHGVSGYLVPCGSVDALVKAMIQVLATDPAELWRLGKEGAARVRANHDAAIEASRLAGYIRDAVARQQQLAALGVSGGIAGDVHGGAPAADAALAARMQSAKAS